MTVTLQIFSDGNQCVPRTIKTVYYVVKIIYDLHLNTVLAPIKDAFEWQPHLHIKVVRFTEIRLILPCVSER